MPNTPEDATSCGNSVPGQRPACTDKVRPRAAGEGALPPSNPHLGYARNSPVRPVSVKTHGFSNFTKRLEIRVTPEQLATLKERTKGMKNASDHFRALLLMDGKSRTFRSVRKTDRELIFQIRKIGINLNQIARHMNTLAKAGKSIDASQAIIALELIRLQLEEIQHAHKVFEGGRSISSRNDRQQRPEASQGTGGPSR